jgi:4-carboxymuconolactone decarboxylase
MQFHHLAGEKPQVLCRIGSVGWLVEPPSFTDDQAVASKHQPTRIVAGHRLRFCDCKRFRDFAGSAARQAFFNRPFVELLNTYCWNDVWNRPGLDRKTRSMLNLAMLSALGKEHELKLHLNGALNNGLSKEQIREVLLQVAIYCGVPAAVVAFRCAKEVFKDRGV